MRRISLFVVFAIAMLTGVVTLGGGTVHAAEQTITIGAICYHPNPENTPPEFNCVETPADNTAQLPPQQVSPALVGTTCTDITSTNNPGSLHQGNNILVTSAGGQFLLENVEGSNDPVTASGSLTLGESINFLLTIGPDNIFSGGLTITLTGCEFPEPTPPTAAGECGDDGVFRVTITNPADGVDLQGVTVEGGDPFPLPPGTSETIPVLDDGGDDVQIVYGQDIPSETIPFEECEAPPAPSFTASGVCVEDDFQVTVANTGDVPLEVTVEGDGTFALAPGASNTVVADDVDAGGTVIVSTDQDIDPIAVPFEECEPSPPTAAGECGDDGVFRVTITNPSDGVDLQAVSVEGGDPFPLAPGASRTIEIVDDGGDDVQIEYGQDIPSETVPFEDCEGDEPVLAIESIGPVCIADIPYIEYDLDVSGLEPEPTEVDIVLFDLNGDPIPGGEYPNQPLQGQLLWPGASDDPEDWPGWLLNEDGFWVPDPSDAFYREGIIVQGTVNPTAEATVGYPPATAACNSPDGPFPPTATPTTNPTPTQRTLPSTGSATTLIALLAVFFTAAGGSLLLAVRRRPT